MEEEKAAVDTSRFKITPLTADNYFLWSCKIELILRGKGLWNITTGAEIEPSDQQMGDHFLRRRDTALSLILLSIDDSCISSVIRMRNPTDVWKTLRAMFEKVSEARNDAYLTQLQRLKINDNEKVMELVNRQTNLENKLVAVGHTVSAEEKRRTFMRALRPEFKVAVQVVRSSGKPFQEAVADLVTYEAEQEMDNDEYEDTSQALNVNVHSGCSICGVPLPKEIRPHTTSQCFYNPKGNNYKPQLASKKHNRKQGGKGSQRRQGNKSNAANQDTEVQEQGDNKKPRAYIDFSFVAQARSTQLKIRVQVKLKWFIDSGASRHMCNDINMFANFFEDSEHSPVSVGNGDRTRVKGEGTIFVHALVKGQKRVLALTKVLYVPELMCNLISVSKMRESKCRIVFDEDVKGRGICEVISRENERTQLVAVEKEQTGLYEALIKPFVPTEPAVKPRGMIGSLDGNTVWHNRLGHVSDAMIRKSAPLVRGINIEDVKPVQNCEPCHKAKSKRSPRSPATEDSRRTMKPLDLMHCDLVGPMRFPSLNESRYFMPLFDDGSGASLCRFLRTKKQASAALKEMIIEYETVNNCKIKKLVVRRVRTDNAKEFLSKELKRWLKEKGIEHELSAPYSPESNGKAERLNRTLMDMARSMLAGAKHLPNHQRLWAEAVANANFIRNRLFTASSNDPLKTPYETIYGKKPDLNHVRTFGCEAFVHIPKVKRKDKFGERATKGFLMGHERGNSYRVYVPGKKKTIVSRDVTFNEQGSQEIFAQNRESGRMEVPDNESSHLLDPKEMDIETEITGVNEDPVGNDHINSEDDSEEITGPQEVVTHYPETTRSGRVTKQPERFIPGLSSVILQAQLGNEDVDTPLSYKEAMLTDARDEWQEAMKDKINDLNRHTWKLVKLPRNFKAIKNKWVYVTKRDSENNLTRRRARLVAKGFSQSYGIDYDEVFAPVAKYSTVRFMLALASQQELEMLQLDVKKVFLNGELEEEIYLEQPEGFVIAGKENHVYRMLRAIYGLKQASNAWKKVVKRVLEAIGFKMSQADSSLFIMVLDGSTVYIIVYVDDMLIIGTILKAVKKIAEWISERFEVRIEQSVTTFLGILIDREKETGTTKIHSTLMIENILKKFNMQDAKQISTPLPTGINLTSRTSSSQDMTLIPYRQLVGTLLHLANTTRPDISFTTGLLSRYLENPQPQHWNAAKYVLRYLKKTKTLGIVYRKKERVLQGLIGYTDSDFAGDKTDRKSTSGYVFKLAGGAVSWRTKKQTVTALSTQEAEYMAMNLAIREALWMRILMGDVSGTKKIAPIPIHTDSTGAKNTAEVERMTDQNKHISTKFHFNREKVQDGSVKLHHTPSTEMVADIMTISLNSTKHAYFPKEMGML